MKQLLAIILAWGLLYGQAWAAFPAVAASATSNETANTTTHNVSYPSGIALGHLLVLLLGLDGDSVTISSGLTGWTQFATTTGGGRTFFAYYKTAAGTETGTLDLTSSASEKSAHIMLRITGQHALTAPEGTADVASTETANPDPPTFNPTNWDAEDTLWIAGYIKDNDGDTQSAVPANYSGGLYIDSAGGGGTADIAVGMAWRQLNAASEDPGTFTISTARFLRAFTLAVRPAAAAGGSSMGLMGVGR